MRWAVALACTSTPALAGPSLLVDGRLWSSTETPSLGRGYFPPTNTFRSSCLEGAPGTQPTADYSYDFIQVEDEVDAASKLHTAWSVSFVQDRMRAFARLGRSSGQVALSILVLLDVSTYYASVDESRSTLSATARKILHDQGVPAFFSTCGSAYVRGVIRNAQLVSVLTYFQGSPARDLRFESALRHQLLGVEEDGAGPPPELPGHKRLTISTHAWGMGRAEGVTLVSSDIPTFKRAVVDAFKAMNGPRTGRVVSVEIEPWAEHPDFLAQVRLGDLDQLEGQMVPLELKKDVLTSNSELLVEAEDAARARLDAFYRARLCRTALKERWASQDGTALSDEAKGVRLKNHRTVQPTRSVAELDQSLTSQRLDQLWSAYEGLTTGTAEGTVARCRADLMGGEAGPRGLFLRRWQEVGSCAALQKRLAPEPPSENRRLLPPGGAVAGGPHAFPSPRGRMPTTNRKQTLRLCCFAAAALAVLPASTAFAGPVLIRDNRVQDLSTTPVLGRGYSLSTNTFQSACLKNVVITEPSYDFQYLFKELESSSTSSSSTTVSANGSYSAFWIEATASASATHAASQGRSAHSILVTLNVDTYYASVNEAGTSLSDSAAALLTNQDVPGFFAACGPYYTRGITRNAQFVSVFTYETTTSKRDTSFEAELQVQLKGFGGNYGVKSNGTFSSEASSKSLTITSRGWGLGKDEEAVLVSYDLDTFKAAVKKAYISTQNPLTGRVTSIEVVPWVENTEFQNTLNLRGTDSVDGKDVPLYEKKDILTFNGEFLTEAERAARLRLNMYYKAKVCRNQIAANYYQGGKLSPDAGKLKLKNHRLAKPGITLAELDGLLTDAAIAQLWKAYEDFLYKGKPNMTDCVTELMRDPSASIPAPSLPGGGEGAPPVPGGGVPPAANTGTGRGVFLHRFSSLKSCQELQKNFAAVLPEKIEDHCMPEPL